MHEHEFQHVYRRNVANCIYSIWTRDGSDISGLALPFFEGQVDALGMYITDLLNEGNGALNLNTQENIQEIERLKLDKMTYAEFDLNFMSKNKPVIISGLSKNWRASSKWVVRDPFSNEKEQKLKMVPNMGYLKKKFGDDTVSVHLQQGCGGFKGSSTRSRKKQEMTLNDFADWWIDYHLLLSEKEENRISNEKNADDMEGEDILYMKDWKFVAEHPTYEAYTTPIFFSDDWLNGPTGMGHAYKFCYLGPKGTTTPLHADVLNSYSWSTNICGRKRWHMVPSEYTHLLYDVFGRRLAAHMNADHDDYIGNDFGTCLYPGLAEARRSMLCVMQEEGETLFVPSGWHHTVENMEATLSINHNWLNGNNILKSWERIMRESTNENDQRKHSVPSKINQEPHVNIQPNGDLGNENLSVKALQKTLQGNDLQLLWLIVSRKAKEIMSVNQKGPIHISGKGKDLALDSRQTSRPSSNLKNILCILRNMKNLLQSNDENIGLSCKNNHIDVRDIHDLITEINVYLHNI